MTQAKADCYFTNGTEKVRFVVRFIFNLEEYARFDSDLGMFVALTELGKPDAELWNSRPDILATNRASVDMLCRRNYKLGAPFTVERRGEAEVGVSLVGAWAWLFFLVLGSFLLQDVYPPGSGTGETLYDLSPVVTHLLSSGVRSLWSWSQIPGLMSSRTQGKLWVCLIKPASSLGTLTFPVSESWG